MFIVLICGFSFILVFKSILVRPPAPILSDHLISYIKKVLFVFDGAASTPKAAEPSVSKILERVDAKTRNEMSLLDLPELALEIIIERVPPAELCRMAGVCRSLRDRCTRNHLWKRHFKQKWGGVIGNAAYTKWQCHVTSSKWRLLNWSRFFGYILTLNVGSKPESRYKHDSVMALCMSLESGKFWFPAQVYNRENGYGFLLSCYDAQVSYNSTTDTFQARYSPRGRHSVIEENVSWDRIRSPPVDTPPFALHVSDDCLEDVKPEDHVEIQWRRNKDYPYGWWYGVVGHLDSCIRDHAWCGCHHSDTVMVEFNQYPVDSRWRRTAVNRKNQREVGNEADGFYGGVRKLYDQKQISAWKSIFPKNVME